MHVLAALGSGEKGIIFPTPPRDDGCDSRPESPAVVRRPFGVRRGFGDRCGPLLGGAGALKRGRAVIAVGRDCASVRAKWALATRGVLNLRRLRAERAPGEAHLPKLGAKRLEAFLELGGFVEQCGGELAAVAGVVQGVNQHALSRPGNGFGAPLLEQRGPIGGRCGAHIDRGVPNRYVGLGAGLPLKPGALSAATIPSAIGAVRRARSARDCLVAVHATPGALDALEAREGRQRLGVGMGHRGLPAFAAGVELEAKARDSSGAVWFGHCVSVSRPATGPSILLGRHASSRAQCTLSQRFRAQVRGMSAESGAEG